MKPFIVLENMQTRNLISIYDNGVVYGKHRGDILGTLSDESLSELKLLINTNMYMFKSLTRYVDHWNSIALHVRDDSRKHRDIRIIGWSQIPLLTTIIRKTESLQDLVI